MSVTDVQIPLSGVPGSPDPAEGSVPAAAEASPPNRGEAIAATPPELALDVPQGRNVVVVVGIDDYQHWPKLHNAVKDALGMQQILEDKLGFRAPFPPLLDEAATREVITRLIEDDLRVYLQPDDTLIFFF